jgi:hypothetical protein
LLGRPFNPTAPRNWLKLTYLRIVEPGRSKYEAGGPIARFNFHFELKSVCKICDGVYRPIWISTEPAGDLSFVRTHFFRQSLKGETGTLLSFHDHRPE